MNLQWYPGHMAKAKREINESLKLVDIVIELIDARIPYSSRNPEVKAFTNSKKHLCILNKSDLAIDENTKLWLEKLNEESDLAISLSSTNPKELKKVLSAIDSLSKDKKEKNQKKGIKNTKIRALILGIPNVGKSTFINLVAKRSAAASANKPGVTKSLQWIKVNKEIELLDTPGILWPKFDDEKVGINLYLVGSIKDELVNKEEMAIYLLDLIKKNYYNAYFERYGVELTDNSLYDLEALARKRGAILKNDVPDLLKASSILLDDFKNKRLGKITLDEI